MEKVSYKPKGYNNITPYLIIKDALKAIDYYQKVFGAIEILAIKNAEGKISHAELKMGDSVIMLADESPHMNHNSPHTYGGTSVGLLLYVEDVDTVFDKALQAGAALVEPLQNMFYGDRSATITDPFGHKWTISTHIEDVPPEEMEERIKAFSKST